MDIVRLQGGLGNQLFQFSFGKMLEGATKRPVAYDARLLLHCPGVHGSVPRVLDLPRIVGPVRIATEEEMRPWPSMNPCRSRLSARLSKLKVKSRSSNSSAVVDEKTNDGAWNSSSFSNKSAYYLGYWQQLKYALPHRRALMSLFEENTKDACDNALADEIGSQEALCLNVRRGDYITHKKSYKSLGALSVGYYLRAVETVLARVSVSSIYVFSDDITWCEENLRFDCKTMFVSHKYAGASFTGYLRLMTHCRHFAIPNSTFGWWAAWLGANENSVVVAPDTWHKSGSERTQELLPESWVRIPSAEYF